MMKNILFMCVANSARSQMAEGLARFILAGKARVESAGSVPTTIHPLAIAALADFGVDAAAQQSKAVKDLPQDFLNHLDFVITLCAEEVCPVVLSKAKKLHWPLPDPAKAGGTDEEKRQQFFAVRDELRVRLTQFLHETL